MIDYILFDSGSVLLELDNEKYMAKELKSPEKYPIIRDALFWDWPIVDLNSMPYEEYVDEVIRRVPDELKDDAKYICWNWFKNIQPVEGMPEVIQSLKGKYPLILVSNAPTVMRDEGERYWYTPYFDQIYYSCDYHLIKPDPAFYQYVLDHIPADPTRCVFFDDKQENVDAANALGIHAFRFDNNPEFVLETIERLSHE